MRAPLLGAAMLAAALCAGAFLFLSERAGGVLSLVADVDEPLDVSIEKGGMCSIGQFLPAMSCSHGSESASCCGGLKVSFNGQCACKALPGVVISHGANSLGLLDNYIRCGYTEGTDVNGDPIPPVDFVTERQGCADRKEWCNDKLHNIDVRISAADRGYVQVHDRTKGWVYAHTDENNTAATGSLVCHVMGYVGLVEARIDQGVHASKRLNCPSDASLISACKVEDKELQTGGLHVRCDTQHGAQTRSELCTRVSQGGPTYNNLQCMTAESTGIAVEGHVRRPGSAHSVCGTAGINESRIVWADGFQDDYFAYTVSRTANGQLAYTELYKGMLAGRDLMSTAELEVAGRRRGLDNFVASFGDLEGTLRKYFVEQTSRPEVSNYDWDVDKRL